MIQAHVSRLGHPTMIQAPVSSLGRPILKQATICRFIGSNPTPATFKGLLMVAILLFLNTEVVGLALWGTGESNPRYLMNRPKGRFFIAVTGLGLITLGSLVGIPQPLSIISFLSF
jgi:hypothetical protein